MVRVSDAIASDMPYHFGLPHKEWRPYQREALAAVIEAMRDHQYVLLDAPTGTGKTAIGVALGHAMGRACYVTQTINLQAQYLQTCDEAVTVTGRQNHPCELGGLVGDVNADEGPCPCAFAPTGQCSYYAQWIDASLAKDTVLNYAFAARVMQGAGLQLAPGEQPLPNPFTNRAVLVCDEGHLLEGALRSAATVNLNTVSMRKVGLRPPETTDLEQWFEWASENEGHINDQHKTWGQRFGEMIRGHVPISDADRLTRRRWTAIWRAVRGLQEVDNAFLAKVPSGYELRPLWVWGRARGMLLGHAVRTLIMSATLGAPWLTARLLGLQEGDWASVRMPMSFPVANRPVFVWGVAKMKHGMAESEKFRQVQALEYLANLGRFKHEKGVVHVASYELGAYLYANVSAATRRRMIFHKPETRGQAFHDFVCEPEEGDPVAAGAPILVSPSAMTGVDWPGTIGWQMIPKIPFADLGDPTVRLRFEYVEPNGYAIGKAVYAHEAANMVVQACGRCVRDADDKGVTIITDSNFWSLYNTTAKDAFPSWFRDAVRPYHPGANTGGESLAE